MENEPLFLSYLAKKGHATSSIESYVRTCRIFINWATGRHTGIECMTYSELLDYVSHLRQRGLSQHSIQGYLAAITHYFEALVEAGILSHNPGRYLGLKTQHTRKIYPVLSREQLENLYGDFDVIAYAKTRATAKASALRNRVATGLLVFQGLDVTALSGLTIHDVDLVGGKLDIKGSRTHAARTLPLRAVQIIELDRYMVQTRGELQRYFHREEDDRLLVSGYARYCDTLRPVVKRLRRQEPRLQSIRHIRASVITHWLRQYNLREVQYMAGHKSVYSTELYQRNDTEELQVDVDRFHPLDSEAQGLPSE